MRLLLVALVTLSTQAFAEPKPKGEVIIIEEKLSPPTPPKEKRWSVKAPPYSDRAILSDAWTKAWMLLEVSETGKVTRFKWLKRPGYDLEAIAKRVVFDLDLEPAKDREGKPMPSLLVWELEWPSHWWMVEFQYVPTRKVPEVGFPPQLASAHVPCAGSGPLHLGSIHPVYKDCSKPDLSKAKTEAWVYR